MVLTPVILGLSLIKSHNTLVSRDFRYFEGVAAYITQVTLSTAAIVTQGNLRKDGIVTQGNTKRDVLLLWLRVRSPAGRRPRTHMRAKSNSPKQALDDQGATCQRRPDGRRAILSTWVNGLSNKKA